MYYRQTNDSDLLARATNEIQTAFPMLQYLEITNLFIATWDSVGYYSGNIDKVYYSNYVLICLLYSYNGQYGK